VQSTGRDPIEGEAALSLLDGVSDLYVAKGKKTLHVDLTADRPSDPELLSLLLGRSGKLRAPAIKVSGRLLVGYNDKILREHLG
jgi:arsenate reductase-like glutaredoxin family protein